MSQIRQVTLEILRHGPAHNQLLSPLTKYLVLCGNHSPETLELPWEHQELMSHLRILRYQDSPKTLEIERRTLGRRLATVLGDIKSLISELSPHHQSPCGQAAVTDLRLVLSSEELALIPFELALTPEGCPGSGEALVLQNQAPLTITRQARRINNRCFAWPKTTRILFAAASPGAEIPLEDHLLALRKALAPWIPMDTDGQASRKRFKAMVHFLPEASWQKIADCCRQEEFSHVHILAHGQSASSGEEGERFGLALHSDRGPGQIDWVDGQRLADALRCFRNGNGGQSCPAVVTLATCDGANAGPVAGVLGCGSSIAHSLHEAGVPLVVASQFPLSFRGSAIFAESFYENLLRGKDPRLLMSDLRRRLHGSVPNRHDWASLVSYCALPADFESQLAEHRMLKANHSARVALNWADHLIAETDPKSGGEDCEKDLAEARAMAKRAIDWLGDCCADPTIGLIEARKELGGLLASAEKRLAEIEVKADQDYSEKSLDALCRSRGHYRRLFEEDPPRSWALVQFLVLELLLRSLDLSCRRKTPNYKKRAEPGLTEKDLKDFWETAYRMSEHELRYRDKRELAWALASLVELQLIGLVLKRYFPDLEVSGAKAIQHAEALARRARDWHMEVYSTRRQIERYIKYADQFAELDQPESSGQAESLGGQIASLVERLRGILPELRSDLD